MYKHWGIWRAKVEYIFFNIKWLYNASRNEEKCIEKKKEWTEDIAKTHHKIMNLNKSQKKFIKPLFFLMTIFENNCDLNNSIVIYENGYFVNKPNKSGV